MTNQRKARSIETQHGASTIALTAKLPWMVEMLPPNSLKPAKCNAKTHNDAQIDLLANSLSHFGFCDDGPRIT